MKGLITQFYPYAKKQLAFDKDVKVILRKDLENAKNPLGSTGHYDPSNYTIVLYTADRHPKDVLRSFAHELTHHAQNCRGEFKGGIAGEQGYAQNDPHLRNMELEAYRGSILVRDWEDTIKGGNLPMSKQLTITEEQLRITMREILSSFTKKGKATREEDKLKEVNKLNDQSEEKAVITEQTEEATEEETQKSDKEWYYNTLQNFLVDDFTKK